MIRCEATIEVGRPPAEAFAFLDDVSKAPQWLGLCAKLEATSPPPKRAGTTLRYAHRQGPSTGEMDGVVTEFEAGRRLAMRFTDKMFEVAVAFRVEPAGAGSRIEYVCEITPRSFMARMMTPMIRGATAKQVAEDTAKLKELLSA